MNAKTTQSSRKGRFSFHLWYGLFLVTCSMFIYFLGYSQTLDLEKEYTLSKKAKKGQLGDVSCDAKTGNYKLIYITKASSTRAKFETYVFDKDFNFISQEEDELEASAAKAKYAWWNWKGEEYTVNGVTAERNLSGKLILRKLEITHYFSWWNLGYNYKVKQLDKVKLRSEEGDKYHYITHFEDNSTGDLYIVVTVKPKSKSDGAKFKEVTLLKINNNLDVVARQIIKCDTTLLLTYAGGITQNPESEGIDNLFFVFGKMLDEKDQVGANYTIYHTNNKLENIEKISFSSPKTYWRIAEVIWDESKQDYYYIGGATNNFSDYSSAVATDMFPDAPANYELESYLLMKTNGGKVAYFTDNPLQQFKMTLMKPPSQKKSSEYRGKKFQLHDYFIDKNGHLFISGQNWVTKYNVILKDFRAVYQDILGFHFNEKGKLVNSFCYDTKENGEAAKVIGASQSFIQGISGDKLYWIVYETEDYKEKEGWIMQYPVISNISTNTGLLSDFAKLGKDGYFVDKSYPFLETPDKGKVVFFGSNKSGKVIWFLRVKLD